MKLRYDKKFIALALIFGFFAVLSLIAVSQYTQAIFLVFLLWIVIPIFVLKLYRSIRNRW